MLNLRACRFVAAALVAASAFLSAAKAADEDSLPEAERVFIASKIYSLIPTFFAHWEGAPSLNLDAAYREYLQKILSTDERRQFDLATMEFIAKLHNGHTDFWDPWVIDHYGHPRRFDAMYMEEKWVVTQSSIPELKIGDVIASIDNQPFEQYFASVRKYLSGSNEWEQRRRIFSPNSPLPHTFSIKLEDGRIVQAAPKPSDPNAKKTPPETTEGRWLHENTMAYIKIPSFDGSEFEKSAIGFVEKFTSAKSLIIDVRGNTGGGTPGDLIRSLMDRPIRHWMETTPASFAMLADEMDNDSAFHLGYKFEYQSEISKKTIYSGRLILLADRDCTSACEDFLMPFKDNGRATLVGETTFGSSGHGYGQRFENGMFVRIGEKREYFPDGSQFEGVGIKPDVEVHLRAEDLKFGKDPVLERAMTIASQR